MGKKAATLSAIVFIVALAGALASRAEADDKTHEGTVVTAGSGKLTMKDKDGKEHAHIVGADATITVNGKAGKLEDMKAGQKVTVTTDDKGKVTKVASRDA